MEKKNILIILGLVAVIALLLPNYPLFTQSWDISWSPSWIPQVGHDITATFTWNVMIKSNAIIHYNYYAIYDPKGNLRAHKSIQSTEQGSISLTVKTDMSGNWKASMWIYYTIDGVNWYMGYWSETKYVRPKSYSLSVSTVPTGARVWIVETGETKTSPCTFSVTAGTYTVEATKSGYGTAKQTVTISSDTSITLNLPPPPPKYTLTVKTNPSYCDVSIGASGGVKNSGTTGAVFTGLGEGYYIVHVEKQGYQYVNNKVYINSDKTITVTLSPLVYTLTVKTNPTDATVTVIETGDTANSGTNGATFNLNYGTYTIKVEKTNYQTETTTVTLDSSKTITVELTQNPPPTVSISYELQVVAVMATALGVAGFLIKRFV